MENIIGWVIGIPLLLFTAYLILAVPYSTLLKPIYKFFNKKNEKILPDIVVSDEDRKKFKSEIDKIFLKLTKKLNDITKEFEADREFNDNEITDIITKKLKGTTTISSHFFEFKEFEDFTFSVNFRPYFNYGCYGRKKYHGISFEYFSKAKLYKLKLDTEIENDAETKSMKNLIGAEAFGIIEKFKPGQFKKETTVRSKLLYEKMFALNNFIDSKIFDTIFPK